MPGWKVFFFKAYIFAYFVCVQVCVRVHITVQYGNWRIALYVYTYTHACVCVCVSLEDLRTLQKLGSSRCTRKKSLHRLISSEQMFEKPVSLFQFRQRSILKTMADVDPDTLLEWLQMGQGDERDMQLIALEQLCMLLLMSDNVDRCFET